MIDAAGRAAFCETFAVPRETQEKLDRFVALVDEHGRSQNLVSASTMSVFWDRHILDSAQLLRLAPVDAATWVDVGSGAGLPGMVVAILSNTNHTLVEPRRLRAQFLRLVVEDLGLQQRVTVRESAVLCVKNEKFAVITARAFASLSKTLDATYHLAGQQSLWLLHKGRNAGAEVAEARRLWEGDVSLMPSVTDPAAAIVKLAHMRRRMKL